MIVVITVVNQSSDHAQLRAQIMQMHTFNTDIIRLSLSSWLLELVRLLVLHDVAGCATVPLGVPQVMYAELNPDSELRKVNVSKSIKLGDFPAG